MPGRESILGGAWARGAPTAVMDVGGHARLPPRSPASERMSAYRCAAHAGRDAALRLRRRIPPHSGTPAQLPHDAVREPNVSSNAIRTAAQHDAELREQQAHELLLHSKDSGAAIAAATAQQRQVRRRTGAAQRQDAQPPPWRTTSNRYRRPGEPIPPSSSASADMPGRGAAAPQCRGSPASSPSTRRAASRTQCAWIFVPACVANRIDDAHCASIESWRPTARSPRNACRAGARRCHASPAGA